MSTGKPGPSGGMHTNQILIDVALVRRLVDTQFPQWADLPIRAVPSAGTVNALYRLGDQLVARLPLLAEWAEGAGKVQRWLPAMAARLPLEVPVSVTTGEPSDDYPLPWSINSWLPGETATTDLIADPEDAALRLADFVRALREIDPSNGPPPSERGLARGLPLERCDRDARAAIEQLSAEFDTSKLAQAWQEALAAPRWDGPATWLHGDLYSANILVADGAVSAVIDWEGMAVGDPAADLTVAWDLFDADTRRLFREASGADDATWARGRGWALAMGVVGLPYYRDTNLEFAELARRLIANVLTDDG